MRKKFLYVFAILVVSMVAAFNMNLSTNQKDNQSLLSLENIEALAQYNPENSGLIRGYTEGTKTEWAGWGVSIGYPSGVGISVNWRSYKCCVSSSQMNGCDFSMQDKECGRL